MKFKILLLTYLIFATFSAKADHFNSTTQRYAKISLLDAALNSATTIEEIEAVSYKMYELIVGSFNDTCPPPNKHFYKAICGDIAARNKAPDGERQYYEYNYEKRIWEASCINIGIDDEETILKKLRIFWNKYKTKCTCDSLDFHIPNGNLLKFALSQKMPELIETLADAYGLDINFIDPKDGMNLLDYVLSQISYYEKLPNGDGAGSVKVYEEYKTRIIDLGGKPSK